MADPKKYPQLQDAIDKAAQAAADAAPVIADADAAQVDLDTKQATLDVLTKPSQSDIDHNEAAKAAQVAALAALEDKAVKTARLAAEAATETAKQKNFDALKAQSIADDYQAKVEQLTAQLDDYEAAQIPLKEDGGGDAVAADAIADITPSVKP